MTDDRDNIGMNNEDDDLDIQALFQKYLNDTAGEPVSDSEDTQTVQEEKEAETNSTEENSTIDLAPLDDEEHAVEKEKAEPAKETKTSDKFTVGNLFSRFLHIAEDEEEEVEEDEVEEDEVKEDEVEIEPLIDNEEEAEQEESEPTGEFSEKIDESTEEVDESEENEVQEELVKDNEEDEQLDLFSASAQSAQNQWTYDADNHSVATAEPESDDGAEDYLDDEEDEPEENSAEADSEITSDEPIEDETSISEEIPADVQEEPAEAGKETPAEVSGEENDEDDEEVVEVEEAEETEETEEATEDNEQTYQLHTDGSSWKQLLNEEDEKTKALAEQNLVSEDELDREDLSNDEFNYSTSEGAVVPPKDPSHSGEKVDDTDINLMVAFGMDDELNKTIGFEKADRIREKMESSTTEKKRERVDFEFTSNGQIPGINAAYKSSRRGAVIKFIIALVCAGYLLFFENVSMLGIQFSGFLDPVLNPITYIMLGLFVGLIACVCAYEQLFHGFAKLFKGEPSVDAILSVYFICNLVYSVLLVLTDAKYDDIQLFNAPLAFVAAFSILHEYISIRREMASFAVVSARQPKYVLKRIPASQALPETQAAKSESDVLRIEKADFVSGFFERICTHLNRNGKVVSFFCVMIPMLSIVAGVAANYVGSHIHPFRVAAIAFSAGFPLAMLFLSAYPLMLAVKESIRSGATIVGEYALQEYADATLMSLDESLLFPRANVRVQNIKVYGNYRLDKVMFFAASLFAKTGGPLAEAMGACADESVASADIDIGRISRGMISAKIDGKDVTFGSIESLIAAGFPDVFPDEENETSPDIRYMYMFREDVLVAQITIQYVMEENFKALMRDMVASGLDICIRSCDPNIDKRLIMDALEITTGSIHVMKFPPETEKGKGKIVDAGIVTCGTPSSLLKTLDYCDKVERASSACAILPWISAILGLILPILLVVLGKVAWINSLYVSIYQLFWLIPVWLIAKIKIK